MVNTQGCEHITSSEQIGLENEYYEANWHLY